MRPIHLHVGHFRSLRDFDIDLSPSTIMVGTNGVGKSTVLHALSFFFSPTMQAGDHDVHGECDGEPVEVTATFAELKPLELERYGHLLADARFVVRKRCGSGQPAVYEIPTRVHEPFQEIRGQTPKLKNSLFRTFAADNERYDFPTVVRSADEVDQYLSDWESQNPSELSDGWVPLPMEARSRQLFPSTVVRFIPAVQQAKIEQSPVEALVQDLIVTPAEENDELQILRDTTNVAVRALFPTGTQPIFTAVEQRLSRHIAEFSPESSAALAWDVDDEPVAINVPKVSIDIVEDGYAGALNGKGHGLQRAVILGAMRLDLERVAEDGAEPPDVILLFEEPELYLHPTRARHVAETLRRLVNGDKINLIMATHSPYFTELADFTSIRLLRRAAPPTGKRIPLRTVRAADPAAVAARLSAVNGKAQITLETLLSYMYPARDILREAYFAEKVVLCEGIEDVAHCRFAAKMCGFDLDALDIAVIPVHGKDGLEKPFTVLEALGIPVYLMFDADAKNTHILDIKEKNHRLLRLVNAKIEDAPADIATSSYAVWHDDLGVAVEASLPPGTFTREIEVAANALGVKGKDKHKKPLVIEQALTALRDAGYVSSVLNDLGTKLKEFASA